MGLSTVMITGDNGRTAAIARQVAIPKVLAEVLPERKAGEVQRLQAAGARVAWSATESTTPALAQADIGLAITGTDVAIEASDITLISGSLSGVLTAIALSRATMRNIRQNLFFALVYNAVGIPIAAGLLYPFFGIHLSPIIAGRNGPVVTVSGHQRQPAAPGSQRHCPPPGRQTSRRRCSWVPQPKPQKPSPPRNKRRQQWPPPRPSTLSAA